MNLLPVSSGTSAKPCHAYVGSYAPNGQGIYRFALNGAEADLQSLGAPDLAPNPSFLLFNADHSRLYVANEHEDFQGRLSGSVSVYRRDAASGALSLAGCVASGGARPVHLSMDAQERHLFVANYGCGRLAVLALDAAGGLGQQLDQQSPAQFKTLQPYTALAQQAPPGSFAHSDHDGPHAHQAMLHPSGQFLLSTDLGLDQIISWQFDARSGRLSAPRCHPSSAGAGPRQLCFHPRDASLCYVLNEESSTLSWWRFDVQAGGVLRALGEISTLPAGFAGTSFASELQFTPDGSQLLCLNRLHDANAIFELDAAGSPQLLGHEWTRGSYPRSGSFDPSGRFFFVCNQRSDHLAVFRLAERGAGLQFTGRYVPVPSPAHLVFAKV